MGGGWREWLLAKVKREVAHHNWALVALGNGSVVREG
jgi:hypothetical protein